MTTRMRRIFAAYTFLITGVVLGSTGALAQEALTVSEARERALEFNRTYLQAKQEVIKAEGDIAVARAGAFPEINLSGTYDRNFLIPSFFFTFTDETGRSTTQEFKTGFENNFGATLSLRQSIWQGGKVFTAWQIAKLYKRYSGQVADGVRAEVVYQTEALFYDAVLQESRLEVLQKSLEANEHNVEMVEKQYDQGLVSEFELLRARVERANLLPQIIATESEVELSRKRLKSFLGMPLTDSLSLVITEGDSSLAGLPPLATFIDSALVNRPEMLQLDYLSEITERAVTVAKADYYPTLEAVSNYNWQAQADEFTLEDNISRSWTAGLVLNIPIFKGLSRSGEVSKAKADHRQTLLQARQVRDDVVLEVEAAYDRLIQAKEALDIQATTIAQAEEGLKIANLRYESGVGTQLEVLSAQAALTEARRARAQAWFFFREAKAQLKRVSTIDIDRITAES